MSDTWAFGEPEDAAEPYGDGTVVPHRKQIVFLNGVAVGEVEIHMHRRSGPDHVTDVSFGLTAVVYGPLPARGAKADTW